MTFKHYVIIQSKSNLLLYSLHYANACNELAGLSSASLRPGNTASFEEMLQRWQAVGNTASDLTGPRFESRTSGSERNRYHSTNWLLCYNCLYYCVLPHYSCNVFILLSEKYVLFCFARKIELTNLS